MIIGSGSLSKLIKDREGAVFFCKGVSDSRCFDQLSFNREYSYMMAAKHYIDSYEISPSFFYFSSILSGKETAYYMHKAQMEHYVRLTFNNYNIIRLGNIWECTNPNTFINYLKSHPEAEIRDEYKYMISADQLNLICQSLPLTGQNEISVFGEMLKVKECLTR